MSIIAPFNDSGSPARSVAYTNVSGQVAAWDAGRADAVLVWTTTDAHVRVGFDATATTEDIPLPAYVVAVIRVPAEGKLTFRASAVRMSANGTLHAKPVVLVG